MWVLSLQVSPDKGSSSLSVGLGGLWPLKCSYRAMCGALGRLRQGTVLSVGPVWSCPREQNEVMRVCPW